MYGAARGPGGRGRGRTGGREPPAAGAQDRVGRRLATADPPPPLRSPRPPAARAPLVERKRDAGPVPARPVVPAAGARRLLRTRRRERRAARRGAPRAEAGAMGASAPGRRPSPQRRSSRTPSRREPGRRPYDARVPTPRRRPSPAAAEEQRQRGPSPPSRPRRRGRDPPALTLRRRGGRPRRGCTGRLRGAKGPWRGPRPRRLPRPTPRPPRTAPRPRRGAWYDPPLQQGRRLHPEAPGGPPKRARTEKQPGVRDS